MSKIVMKRVCTKNPGNHEFWERDCMKLYRRASRLKWYLISFEGGPEREVDRVVAKRLEHYRKEFFDGTLV